MIRPADWSRNVARGFIAAAVFLVTFTAGATDRIPIPSFRLEESSPRDLYVPKYELGEDEQTEIAMIYFTQSTCGACNAEGLPDAVMEVKQSLSRKAADAGYGFSVTGVSLDWVPERGFEHLRRFGNFNEVVIGRNWVNSAALKYMWQEFPGRTGTPQIVVIMRRLQVPGERYAAAQVISERLLARKLGTNEIFSWSNGGAPLPEY